MIDSIINTLFYVVHHQIIQRFNEKFNRTRERGNAMF